MRIITQYMIAFFLGSTVAFTTLAIKFKNQYMVNEMCSFLQQGDSFGYFAMFVILNIFAIFTVLIVDAIFKDKIKLRRKE